MAEGDWGADLEEAQFPTTSASRGFAVDSDDPGTLPQVKAARPFGFEPAPESPVFCFLPAVWPDQARAWVRDLRIRQAEVSCDGGPPKRVPWSTWDYFEIESDLNSTLADCGLAPRPSGRLWLLKPPPQFDYLDAALDHLCSTAERASLPIYAHPGFVDHVAGEVAMLFAEQP